MHLHNHLVVIRVLLVGAVLVTISACAQTPTSPTSEITRERAIQIAQQRLNFEPTSTNAVTDVRQGKPVWVVTFRRADGSHGGLGEFMEVTVDRSTGDMVTLAMS